eukprot:31135-Pelagococcus_subviridis.AAC.38
MYLCRYVSNISIPPLVIRRRVQPRTRIPVLIPQPPLTAVRAVQRIRGELPRRRRRRARPAARRRVHLILLLLFLLIPLPIVPVRALGVHDVARAAFASLEVDVAPARVRFERHAVGALPADPIHDLRALPLLVENALRLHFLPARLLPLSSAFHVQLLALLASLLPLPLTRPVPASILRLLRALVRRISRVQKVQEDESAAQTRAEGD